MATPKITLKREFLHIEDQSLTVAQVFFDMRCNHCHCHRSLHVEQPELQPQLEVQNLQCKCAVEWKEIVLDVIERVVNRYQRTEFTIEELFKECMYVSMCPHLERTLRALQRKGVIEDLGGGEFAYTLYDGDLW